MRMRQSTKAMMLMPMGFQRYGTLGASGRRALINKHQVVFDAGRFLLSSARGRGQVEEVQVLPDQGHCTRVASSVPPETSLNPRSARESAMALEFEMTCSW